ncbi:class I SAM-dependent methyltransferase [Cohnella boryungensis]|uniref:Class I SAM-dependent methyltransferase n=1 Tax=Cohnella boryungensis TaxID=768479 RepID=A0ABV8SEH4_9BACL
MTTSDRPAAEIVARAIRLAEELGAAYVQRKGRTIRALQRSADDNAVIVVGAQEVRLVRQDGQPFYFHPSMALVRLKGLRAGGRDALIAVSEVMAGNTVLDCTAGLCSDSIVFSYAVGSSGRVIACEAVQVLYALVREGLQTYESGIPDIDRAMRAIETVHDSYEKLLPRMKDKSVDIVYFDPMFEKPVVSSSSLQPLRTLAEHEPLSAQAVQEAIRIARKKVILKDHRDSGQFERLGFRLLRSSSAVAYGVIDVD